MNELTAPSPLYLVTGGNGFLGKTLVAALRDCGYSVRSFDLAPHPDTAVQSITGDLRNLADVQRACQDVTTVFHTASHVGWTLSENKLVHEVNVTGTQNLLRACQAAGVRQFIYTSSIDVVFEGKPIHRGDESLPYARRPLNAYSATKAAAEQAVLAANDPQGMLTCALRTAGIFGPGDRYRLPNIIGSARQGRAIRLGNGRARFNHVYIDNVVHAHLLAAQALTAVSPVAGQAYFIVDDPATNFYDFMEPFLEGLGYDIPTRAIPRWLAYSLAVASETLQRLHFPLSPVLTQLTRYTVLSTCVDFNFTHDKAARDFNYQPVVSRPDAIAATLAWLRQAGYAKAQTP